MLKAQRSDYVCQIAPPTLNTIVNLGFVIELEMVHVPYRGGEPAPR
jgi:hypothetical protein